jgi:hypothetical protein
MAVVNDVKIMIVEIYFYNYVQYLEDLVNINKAVVST